MVDHKLKQLLQAVNVSTSWFASHSRGATEWNTLATKSPAECTPAAGCSSCSSPRTLEGQPVLVRKENKVTYTDKRTDHMRHDRQMTDQTAQKRKIKTRRSKETSVYTDGAGYTVCATAVMLPLARYASNFPPHKKSKHYHRPMISFCDESDSPLISLHPSTPHFFPCTSLLQAFPLKCSTAGQTRQK